MQTHIYSMRFTGNHQPARVWATTRAILMDAASGRQVESFSDVVELLQCLPGHDPDYSCRGDWFRINGTGRSYSLGLELEEALEAVQQDGRWRIEERRIGDSTAT